MKYGSMHLDHLRKSLIAQTNRIRSASNHGTTTGSSIEMVVRRTLREFLPSKFHVGMGQVANSNSDTLSPQMDILIYDRERFPHLSMNEDGSAIVCCESVSNVIECKTQWKKKEVVYHFNRFVDVDHGRHSTFGYEGMGAGYFVFIIDKISRPSLNCLDTCERFVGLYSLEGDCSWWSPYKCSNFKKTTGNAIYMFLQHVTEDCMRKGVDELGGNHLIYEIMQRYFDWSWSVE